MRQQTVLVLGGTGRTDGRVVSQLLDRGARVRAIVRCAERLPAGVVANRHLSYREADLLSLDGSDLENQVRGCDAIISCLGHKATLPGVFGPPHTLVTDAMRRVCAAIEASQPVRPVKVILMSSMSVNRPDAAEVRRGKLEKLVLWLLRAAIPPARDNQLAADYLSREVGNASPHVGWACIRPYTLLDGEVAPYEVHETLVHGLFRPVSANMSSVAHFMCELVDSQDIWSRWVGKLPVVLNASLDEVPGSHERTEPGSG